MNDSIVNTINLNYETKKTELILPIVTKRKKIRKNPENEIDILVSIEKSTVNSIEKINSKIVENKEEKVIINDSFGLLSGYGSDSDD